MCSGSPQKCDPSTSLIALRGDPDYQTSFGDGLTRSRCRPIRGEGGGHWQHEVDRVNSRATARRPLDPEAERIETSITSNARPSGEVVAFARPLTALVVAPTLHAGA